MLTREELLKSKEYWLANIQNQLFNHIEDYMKKEGLNRTSLSEQLGVTKGYVSQVLNGDFDHRISKYIELLMATNSVPVITIESVDNLINKEDNTIIVKQTIENTPFKNCYNWLLYSSYTGETRPVEVNNNNFEEIAV